MHCKKAKTVSKKAVMKAYRELLKEIDSGTIQDDIFEIIIGLTVASSSQGAMVDYKHQIDTLRKLYYHFKKIKN